MWKPDPERVRAIQGREAERLILLASVLAGLAVFGALVLVLFALEPEWSWVRFFRGRDEALLAASGVVGFGAALSILALGRALLGEIRSWLPDQQAEE